MALPDRECWLNGQKLATYFFMTDNEDGEMFGQVWDGFQTVVAWLRMLIKKTKFLHYVDVTGVASDTILVTQIILSREK